MNFGRLDDGCVKVNSLKGMPMYVGVGLKSEKVDKTLRQLTPYIDEDEQVLGIVVCNNMRPLVDRLIATDRQLLAVSTSDGIPKWQTPYGILVDVDSVPRKQTMGVRTAGGQDRVFKMIKAEDHRPFMSIVTEQRRAFRPEVSLPYPYSSVEGLSPSGATSSVPSREIPTEETTSAAALDPSGMVDEMVRLAALNDAGFLTDQEFTAAKARLLS